MLVYAVSVSIKNNEGHREEICYQFTFVFPPVFFNRKIGAVLCKKHGKVGLFDLRDFQCIVLTVAFELFEECFAFGYAANHKE